MSVFTPEFIRRLSVDEKLEIIDQLRESLDQDDSDLAAAGGVVLTDAMKRELDRRIAEADANPEAGIPFAEVEAEARERLRKSRSR